MKVKYKKEHNEPDSWKPLADIFSGLMLMFLLILMLIVLFIGYKDEIRDANVIGDDGGYLVHVPDDDGSGGDHEEEEIIGGGGDQDGLAAVKVVIVDADTEKVIKHKGVDFNLFLGYKGEQVTLNTYYPEKVAYTKFETVDDGTFFLPEKVDENTYVLRNITAPDGYISGGSMAFTVPHAYDWDDPYVVYFPMSMKKHSFAIHVTDKDTGKPVPLGEYNISTDDGKPVGTIICDENGYGQSELLPQNDKYVITQSSPNEFYAALEHPVTVVLDGKTDKVVEIQAAKTTAEIYLIDELKKTPIVGATFAVYGDNGALIGEFKTNDYGLMRLQNLNKDTSYTVKQTSWADNWQKKSYETGFTVDMGGRINGYSVYTVTGTNRMIRVNIAAKYKLLGLNISGETMVLTDESGQIVQQWNSKKYGMVIEGINPGRYTLKAGDKAPIEILIEDTAEIQYFSYSIFKLWVLIVVIVGGVAILGGIAAFIIVRKKKKEQELSEEETADESEE